MRCDECLSVLEEYYDGELSEQTCARVAAHVESCATCTRAYERLRREQEIFLRYECDADARSSFWSEVLEKSSEAARPAAQSARLSRRFTELLGAFGAPRFSPVLTAVLLLVAVALTIGVMKLTGSSVKTSEPETRVAQTNDGATQTTLSPPPATEKSAATPPVEEGREGMEEKNSVEKFAERVAAPNRTSKGSKGTSGLSAERSRLAVRKFETVRREPDAGELVREAEQKYLAAIALLSRDVSRRRAPLDAATAARFRQTLAAVDRTIAGTRRAVRQHPSDPVAVQYMLTAYAKKVEVLREMAEY